MAASRPHAGDVTKIALATLPLLFAAAVLLPPDIHLPGIQTADMQIWRRNAGTIATAPVVDVTRNAPPEVVTVQAGSDLVAASAPADAALSARLPGDVVSATHGFGMALNAVVAPLERPPVQPPIITTASTGDASGGMRYAVVSASISHAATLAPEPAGPMIGSLDAGTSVLGRSCRLDEAAGPSFAGERTAWPETVPLGLRIAQAARAQTADFVIYNDRYFGLSYPMGDVPALYGVCTDVVIRALRAAGIDLQVLVREAKPGRGDASIDHRRTEVLRRYFEKSGHGLPVTDLPEDYAPGDIVTYLRPQNPRVQSHIAIVSDVIGPSGRPMIVHNRGWGPQLEDALFADAISGHFRWGVSPSAPSADMAGVSPPGTRPRPLRTTARGRAAKPAPVF